MIWGQSEPIKDMSKNSLGISVGVANTFLIFQLTHRLVFLMGACKLRTIGKAVEDIWPSRGEDALVGMPAME